MWWEKFRQNFVGVVLVLTLVMGRVFLISVSIAAVAAVFLLLWFRGNPVEENLAWLEFLAFLAWTSTVIASFFPSALRNIEYQRFFGTNEKRWAWLLVLTVVFLFLCTMVGWGQPLLRSVTVAVVNGVAEVQKTDTYREGENIADGLRNRVWNFLELDNYKKVLGSRPVINHAPKSTERPFYGLASWSHWIVFLLLYLPTLVVYGVAARREEVLAWVERRRERREERERNHRATASAQGTAIQTYKTGWLLTIEGIIDAVAEIVGTAIGSRLFGGR